MSSHQLIDEFETKQSGNAALKLLVKGFTSSERQMLDAIVKLSQRRQPQLNMFGVFGDDADVVMIDAADTEALKWARQQSWLSSKAVIWVDAAGAQHGLTANRPIQWASLPMLLVRALEQVQVKTGCASVDTSKCQSVLVVDDSAAVRGQIRSLLEARNLIVTEAENAEDAINTLATSSFACILMDVLMPGIDGYEACRLIKANARGNKPPSVVMLTSRTSPFDRIRGKMAGCDGYLTKPVDPRLLYDTVSNFTVTTAKGKAAEQAVPSLQYAR
jgi:two-component system, cell cycle response regulator